MKLIWLIYGNLHSEAERSLPPLFLVYKHNTAYQDLKPPLFTQKQKRNVSP
jgi:hypothetical protein